MPMPWVNEDKKMQEKHAYSHIRNGDVHCERRDVLLLLYSMHSGQLRKGIAMRDCTAASLFPFSFY